MPDEARTVRRRAPAAARNREPIAEVLAAELPATGLVLEIASGTGEHALHFARRFPDLIWQPSDPDPSAIASIAAWRDAEGPANLLPPVRLDASADDWPANEAQAILCINMIHISSEHSARGLLRGAGQMLAAGAPLILYGPYFEDDVVPAPGNIAFDADLKARNPAWGIRRREWVDALAQQNDFALTRRVEMPANNLVLVYRKAP